MARALSSRDTRTYKRTVSVAAGAVGERACDPAFSDAGRSTDQDVEMLADPRRCRPGARNTPRRWYEPEIIFLRRKRDPATPSPRRVSAGRRPAILTPLCAALPNASCSVVFGSPSRRPGASWDVTVTLTVGATAIGGSSSTPSAISRSPAVMVPFPGAQPWTAKDSVFDVRPLKTAAVRSATRRVQRSGRCMGTGGVCGGGGVVACNAAGANWWSGLSRTCTRPGVCAACGCAVMRTCASGC